MNFENHFTIQKEFTGSKPSWFKEQPPELDLSIRFVEKSVVTSGSIEGWPRRLSSGVYDNDMNEVAEAIFMRANRVSFPPEEPISPLSLPTNYGEYVYLGWLISHYGHFITESTSRYWWLTLLSQEQRKTLKILVHANYKSVYDFPSHVAEFFRLLDISLDQIKICNQTEAYESLIVPSPAIRLDYGVNPKQKLLWDFLRKKVQLAYSDSKFLPKKLFLSRTIQDSKDPSRKHNSQQLEKLFVNRGYSVVYPENMSLLEQINAYANAQIIAGPVGSALHNSIFQDDDSKTVIIAPNSFLFKTDSLISSIKGNKLIYFLVDVGSTSIKRTDYSVDVFALGRFLDDEKA